MSAGPSNVALFGGSIGQAHALLIRSWCERALDAQIVRLIWLDLYARLHPKDPAYFRSTREARAPAIGLPALRAALAPVRAVRGVQAYLGGKKPSLADYIVFGALQWARVMSPL